jgi:hypothetical protein
VKIEEFKLGRGKLNIPKAISQNKREPLRNHENKYKQNVNHRLPKRNFFGKTIHTT